MMTSTAVFKGLVFHAGAQLGEHTFIVDVRNLREIVEVQKVHHMPGATPQEPGFILVRQEPVTLLDLAALCGLPSVESGAVVLVLESGSKKVGVRVGLFEDIENIDPSLVQNPLGGLSQPEWVTGLVKTAKGDVALLIDAPSLISRAGRKDTDGAALQELARLIPSPSVAKVEALA